MGPHEVLESIEEEAPLRGLAIIRPRRGKFLDDIIGEHKPSGLLHKGSVVVPDNVKSQAEAVATYLDYVRDSGMYASTYREAPPNYETGEGDAVEVSVRL
jgi:hypothetical protein